MWYKSKPPLPSPLKKKKTAEELKATTGCLAIKWYRKARDDYKDHPMFRELSDKYGPMSGGLYGQINWKGFEPLKDLYLYYVDNKEKFPLRENIMSDKGSDTDKDTDEEEEEDEEDLKVPTPIDFESEMDLDRDSYKSTIHISKKEDDDDDDGGEYREGRGQRKKRKTPKGEQYTGTSTSTSTNKSAKSKQLALGVHLCQVSTKGKIPICRYCRSGIEGRGTWHAVEVVPNSTPGLPAAARNEYHYHCKCVVEVFQEKEINQLIVIVNSNQEINGVDSNKIIDSINSGQEYD